MSETASLPERSRIVQRHLAEAGIDTVIRVLPDSARTAAEAAAAIGCEVSAIANSLVFLADGVPVLVMTSGGHRTRGNGEAGAQERKLLGTGLVRSISPG